MKTKDECIDSYNNFKREFGRIPKFREFLTYSSIPKNNLIQLFGENAYSKLQVAAGDESNKLELERTPLDRIMRQYGELAIELGKLPTTSAWTHKGFSPTPGGLDKVHGIKWWQFPTRFLSWFEETNPPEFDRVAELITESSNTPKNAGKSERADSEFQIVIDAIRKWTPARRRNSEGEYKIELRKHLEAQNLELNEEYGESNIDLLVSKKIAIEIKKDPSQGEFDRMFGQLARHLQHHQKVVALIVDAPSEDKIENFGILVDTYFNVKSRQVEVVKK